VSQQVLISITLAFGVVFGFLVAWFSYRSDRVNVYVRGKSEGDQERIQLQERLAFKEERLLESTKARDEAVAAVARLREDNAALTAAQKDIDARIDAVHRQVATLQTDNTALRASLAAAEARLEESQTLGEGAQQRLRETFQTLASELLQANNQAFLQLAAGTLERFQTGMGNGLDLKPFQNMMETLHSSLDCVRLCVHELETEKTESYSALTQQLGALLHGQSRIRQQTNSLATLISSAAHTLENGVLSSVRILQQAGAAATTEIDFQEPVESIPHVLHALDQATLGPTTDPGPFPQEVAALGCENNGS